MGGVCSTYGDRGAYRILAGGPEGRNHFEDAGVRWEDTIKVDLQELGWDIDWIDLLQDRARWRPLLYAVINLLFP
jgi:hypothetical protein